MGSPTRSKTKAGATFSNQNNQRRGARTDVTAAVDPRRVAAERLHDAFLDARRVGGDSVICDVLDMLGAGAGQQRYRYAAAAIRGLPPGRPAIDDEWALQRILKFPPERRRSAVGTIAMQVTGPGASSKMIKATERRLRRKLENQTDEIVLSPALTP
jgi:hypothetical protein